MHTSTHKSVKYIYFYRCVYMYIHIQNCKGVNYSRDMADSIPKVPLSGMSGRQSGAGVYKTNTDQLGLAGGMKFV